MFEKKSRKLVLSSVFMIIIVLIFASLTLTRITFEHNYSGDFKGELTSKDHKLKLTAIYNDIIIDDLPGSLINWTWAEAQSWCSGSGTLSDPYIIESHLLNVQNQFDGIQISNSHNKYFIIRNCTFRWDGFISIGSETGVFLSNTTNGYLYNNTAYGLPTGIYLYQSENIFITNNTVHNLMSAIYLLESNLSYIYENTGYSNEVGINLDNSFDNSIYNNTVYSNTNGMQISNSKYNEIYENIAYNNDDGILVWYSENNNIKHNKLNNNFDHGMEMNNGHNNTILENELISNTQEGINMVNSHNNTIAKNDIKDNLLDGIYVSNSDDNVISGNIIQNNDDGINLYVSIYNKIYENSIDNNNRGIYADLGGNYNLAYWNFFTGNVIHAIDATSTNYWNFTYIGNYWENYTGVDTDHNGIGDTNHTFNGGIDYLPIWDPDLPTINIISPSNNDLVGRTAPSFIVEVTDVYLEDMWYTMDFGANNVLFTINGTFNQSLWEAVWDSKAEMNDIYIIFYANDTLGHLGSNNVSVIKSVAPIITITSPLEDVVFGAIAPNFTVEVVESNLEFMWYSVDGGLTNVIFTTNGSISQSIWDALPEGGVIIRFYANDSLGNLVFEQVHIFKEIPVPTSPAIGIDFISNGFILLIAIAGSIIFIISGMLKRKRKNL